MGTRTTAEKTRQGGTRHWSARRARQELAAWKASGLPLATFESQKGLRPTRLRWWKNRLGEWSDGEAKASSPAFIPAVVREAVETARTNAQVTVRFPGGVVVEVADPASVPSKWLTAVVSGLSRAE